MLPLENFPLKVDWSLVLLLKVICQNFEQATHVRWLWTLLATCSLQNIFCLVVIGFNEFHHLLACLPCAQHAVDDDLALIYPLSIQLAPRSIAGVCCLPTFCKIPFQPFQGHCDMVLITMDNASLPLCWQQLPISRILAKSRVPAISCAALQQQAAKSCHRVTSDRDNIVTLKQTSF